MVCWAIDLTTRAGTSPYGTCDGRSPSSPLSASKRDAHLEQHQKREDDAGFMRSVGTGQPALDGTTRLLLLKNALLVLRSCDRLRCFSITRWVHHLKSYLGGMAALK